MNIRKIKGTNTIRVESKDGGFIEEQSVKAVLLYEILQELKKSNGVLKTIDMNTWDG